MQPRGRRLSVVQVVVLAAVAMAVSSVGASAVVLRSPRTASVAPVCVVGVSGTWTISQSNAGTTFVMNLIQSGTSITGGATFGSSSGTITGTLVGDQLDIVVDWNFPSGPAHGKYTATVGVGVMSDGNTYQLEDPSNSATWTATGPGNCNQLLPNFKSVLLKALGTVPPRATLIDRGGYVISFPAPGPGGLTVSWYATVGHRRVLVASGGSQFKSAAAGLVKLRLTGHGRTLVSSGARLRLLASATFSLSGANQVSASRTVTLAP